MLRKYRLIVVSNVLNYMFVLIWWCVNMFISGMIMMYSELMKLVLVICVYCRLNCCSEIDIVSSLLSVIFGSSKVGLCWIVVSCVCDVVLIISSGISMSVLSRNCSFVNRNGLIMLRFRCCVMKVEF